MQNMRSRKFIDPLGARLPSLERNLMRLRAIQMVLVLFYAEELKRDVLDTIQSTDRAGRAFNDQSRDRVPAGTKNAVDRALKALVADKALTPAEKDEIVELIDFRNAIGHELHHLLADLGAERVIRWTLDHGLPGRRSRQYRYDAVRRLRHYRKKINALWRTHHYVRTIRHDSLLFGLAERTFIDEVQRLERKVTKLVADRSIIVEQLNAELALKGTGLEDKWHPAGPHSKYRNGRLTKIGVEVCYRLFDMGKSPMAVAHLADLSLVSVRKRRASWYALGGRRRKSVELEALPIPRSQRLDDR